MSGTSPAVSPSQAGQKALDGDGWMDGHLKDGQKARRTDQRHVVRSLVERFDIEPPTPIFQPNEQTLEGSFSLVSTPNFARK